VFNLEATQLLDYDFDGLGASTQLEEHAIDHQEEAAELTQVAPTQLGASRQARQTRPSPFCGQLEPGDAFQETQLEDHARVEEHLGTLPAEALGSQASLGTQVEGEPAEACPAGASGNLQGTRSKKEVRPTGEGAHECSAS